MASTNYCDKCAYRKVFRSGLLPYCDYLCMTGSRRPCPGGDGCTVRVTRSVYRKRERTPEEKAAYAEKMRAKNKAKAHAYYEKNKEKVLAKNRRWRDANRDKLNEYYRERRKRKKEE